MNYRTPGVACLTAAVLCGFAHAPQAGAGVVSDPVTVSKWTLAPGANFISAPAKKSVLTQTKVTAVATDTLSLDVTLVAGALHPVDGRAQYAVFVRHDQTGDGPGTQGDWWTIASNGANSVTVVPQPGFGATASRVAAGDIVEVVKLTSLQDLLGSGASVAIAKDTDFDDTTEGAAYELAGTSFSSTLFYHDGTLLTEGWYLDFSTFLGTGATYTFTPDQPLFAMTTAASDVLVSGILQSYRLSHYIVPGFNPISTGYAAPSPLGTSNLIESGWLKDTDFDDTTEDSLYTLNGTSFLHTVFYHDGSLLAAGWYLDFATLDNAFPLDPGVGFLINHTGPGFVWRQTLPYVP
jgi:hypothetical protein